MLFVLICESSKGGSLQLLFFLCLLPFSSASLWSGLFFPPSLPPCLTALCPRIDILLRSAREVIQLHSQKLPEFVWGQWEFERRGEKRQFLSQKKEKKPGGKRMRSVFTLGKVFENWRLKEIHIVKLSTTTKKKRLFLPSREESKSFCPSHTDTPGLDTAILRRKPTM